MPEEADCTNSCVSQACANVQSLPTLYSTHRSLAVRNRSAVYSQSFTRRAGEKKLPSAVTASEVTPSEGAKVSMSSAPEQRQFTASMRLFHWLTVALVLTILSIGVAMVASLADYHRLVSIHRPSGILILIVVVIRFATVTTPLCRRFPPPCRLESAPLPRRLNSLCMPCWLYSRWSVGEKSCPQRDLPSLCTGRFTPSLYLPITSCCTQYCAGPTRYWLTSCS
jgi:hypothetical protein